MYRRSTPRSLVLILTLIFTAHGWLPPAPRAPQNQLKTSLHAKKKGRQGKRSKEESNQISISQDNIEDSGSEGDSARAKDKAISALSTPTAGKQSEAAAESQPNGNGKNTSSKRTTMRRSKKKGQNSSLLPPPDSKKKRKGAVSKRSDSSKESSFSSLLPPPLPNLKSEESDSLSSGLSSWEEFLGRAEKAEVKRNHDNNNSLLPPPGAKPNNKKKNAKQKGGDSNLELPSISDLFPPDVTKKEQAPLKSKSQSSLDGVLPVTELFYRSSQAIIGEEKEKVAVMPWRAMKVMMKSYPFRRSSRTSSRLMATR